MSNILQKIVYDQLCDCLSERHLLCCCQTVFPWTLSEPLHDVLTEISTNWRDNIDQPKTFREILFILLFNIIDDHHFGPKKCSSPKYSDLVNFIIFLMN